MIFNPLYLLLIVPAVLSFYAQSRVQRAYADYARRPNARGITGEEAARRLLAHHELEGVRIVEAPGSLTDAYDPAARTLRLSEAVAGTASITALGIVGHEVGHALQHATEYRLMRARTWMAEHLAQAAGWGSLAFVAGMLLGSPLLMISSGVVLATLVLFALVSLPVERDASDRAIRSLREAGLATEEEIPGVKRVLRSAALTYLAGLGQRLGRFVFFAIAALAALGLFR